MFEFVTISGGVAVVQNVLTGRVYRFRPIQSGQWNRLTLNSVDLPEQVQPDSDTHADAALGFAEVAAFAEYCSTLKAQGSARDPSRTASPPRWPRWLAPAKAAVAQVG